MSDTHETNFEARRSSVGDTTRYVVSREFAERLERQRDAYAETLREIHESGMVGNDVAARRPELAKGK